MSNMPHPRPGMPPFRAEAPGKNILMAAGIGLIALNILRFFMAIPGILAAVFMLIIHDQTILGELVIMHLLLSILALLFEVAIGIIGVVSCNKIEKGKTLFAVGIIFMALSTIYNIAFIVAMSSLDVIMDFGRILGIPITFVLSILLIVGASKNKKAADDTV